MKRIILKLYRQPHFCLGDGNLLFLTSVEEKKKGNVYPIFQSYLLPFSHWEKNPPSQTTRTENRET
jgi:hypothetical protein